MPFPLNPTSPVIHKKHTIRAVLICEIDSIYEITFMNILNTMYERNTLD